MLNLTLNEINCKKRTIDSYKGMSKNQLINLISPHQEVYLKQRNVQPNYQKDS